MREAIQQELADISISTCAFSLIDLPQRKRRPRPWLRFFIGFHIVVKEGRSPSTQHNLGAFGPSAVSAQQDGRLHPSCAGLQFSKILCDAGGPQTR